MTTTVEFYFDVSSPTAYLAHLKLQAFTEKYDVNVVYEPMLLGGVLNATNNIGPGVIPAKAKYMLLHDIPRFVKRDNVEFQMNPFFPIKSVQLMRCCYAAKELGCFEQYVDFAFKSLWTKRLNLADESVLKAAMIDAGLDGEAILALTQEDSIRQALKDNSDKAVKKGCFGAPTMFIGKEMFFGQDRLDFVEALLVNKT